MTSKEALVKFSGENLSPVMASWASLGVARLGQQPGDSEQRIKEKPRSRNRGASAWRIFRAGLAQVRLYPIQTLLL